MAHKVKCKVCGIIFDRDKEAAVPMGSRRYAHAHCSENYEPSKEEQDIKALHQYLKQLFKDNYNYVILNKQIETLMNSTEQKYTYSGILKSLIYWYEVKGNSIEKANNRIGIVPFVYQDAYQYYLEQFLANEQNVGKNLEEYKEPKVREIRIKPPTREVPKYRLFNLDD